MAVSEPLRKLTEARNALNRARRAEARVAALESEVALYRSALESIRDNSRDHEAASIAQHALKGDEAK